MKTLFKLFFLFASSNCIGQSTIVFDSDSIPEKFKLKNLSGDYMKPAHGIDTPLTGLYTGKNKKNNVVFELNLDKGIFMGEQKYFYENGSIYQTGSFDSGRCEGEFRVYYPDGKIAEKSLYKNGLPDGIQLTYWKNGQIFEEQFFSEGGLSSEKSWDESGNLQHEFPKYPPPCSVKEDVLASKSLEYSLYTVKELKDEITLILMIDSLVYYDHSEKKAISYKFKISNESDIIKVGDSLSIKIFIARNIRYGQKLYSWTWDYFKSTKTCFDFIQSSGSSYLNDDSETILKLQKEKSFGQGIGAKGTPGSFMVYYRYKIN